MIKNSHLSILAAARRTPWTARASRSATVASPTLAVSYRADTGSHAHTICDTGSQLDQLAHAVPILLPRPTPAPPPHTHPHTPHPTPPLFPGEYIFDHRGGKVEGQTFQEWFVYSYMISDETLFHKDPVTGQAQPIGLGWLDDSMTLSGPTEEDRNYIADTGASPADMAAQVAAYKASMQLLIETIIPAGGFFWQLMDGQGARLNTGINNTTDPATCLAYLRSECVASPPSWSRFQLYSIPNGSRNQTAQSFTDYTAEFLLTRGPYALLGQTWAGCTNGAYAWPRAAEWDEDFGEPVDATCAETSAGSGVFARRWTYATVSWDCAARHGTISRT